MFPQSPLYPGQGLCGPFTYNPYANMYEPVTRIEPTPKSTLKPGYVCVTRNGHYLMVLPTEDGLCLCGDDHGPLSGWNSDLTFNPCGTSKLDIMKVYGLSKYPRFACDRSSDGRKLIWERKETKKMTVKEICDALGYDVEIVKEGEQ